MKFIIFTLVLYIIPLVIVKLLNRYLCRLNKKNSFEYAFGLSFFFCLLPMGSYILIGVSLLDVLENLHFNFDSKKIKQRIIKWMS